MKHTRRQYQKLAKWLCIFGGVTCFGGFALAGFDFNNLSTSEPYEKKVVTWKVDELQELLFQTSFEDVQVKPSKDEDIHITYYENNKMGYEVQGTKETLRLEQKNKRKFYEQFMSFDFHEIDQDTSLLIEVPTSYQQDIFISTTNASIDLQGLKQLQSLTLNTTFGDIRLDRVNANGKVKLTSSYGDLEFYNSVLQADAHLSSTFGSIALANVQSEAGIFLDTSNDDIHMDQVTSKGQLEADTTFGKIITSSIQAESASFATTNGAIDLHETFEVDSLQMQASFTDFTFQQLQANQIKLSTTNGDITGTIYGNQEEYTIETEISNGTSSLDNQIGISNKTIKASTTFGDCEITFQ